MLKIKFSVILLFFISPVLFGQDHRFSQFEFLIGSWKGKGAGFGNDSSTIEISYKLIMDDTYIEVLHKSLFEPTPQKPNG